MNFDDMQWVVTAGDDNYGPLSKKDAVELRDRLRAEGMQAEAWAAQAPDTRRLISTTVAR